MNSFWKNLNGLARNQLLSHGHLTPHAAMLIGQTLQSPRTPDKASPKPTPGQVRPPRPRLATAR
ncbi:MAG: hypothetical protein WBV39_06900 [Rudaea sp.]